jgi:sortase A
MGVSPRALDWLERLLVVAATVCLATAYVARKHVAFQDVYAQAARAELLTALEGAGRMRDRARQAPAGDGAVIGVLEIPRLHLSAMVVEGDDAGTLGVAVGHLPVTPLPWQRGNSALAGHRDTFFRPLERVRRGDRVNLITPHGAFEYRVIRLAVVGPRDLWVLDAWNDAQLTLITCYPFRYIGSAPQRFIVHAQRVESAAP